MKTSKQLQRYFKGLSHHRRIDILLLVNINEGVTLDAIAQALKCNMKTASEHTRRLVIAGLLNKKYKGRSVAHFLSPYGKKTIMFMQSFSHS